ncbi:MAG: YCF48-related protein [Betaproteobacteria bacterium]|jgi:photosystem II stability/assembly factor-like uncharacterized protein|nr:YCF48-related protein [Betaproteobacteria bacterium]
MQLAAGLVLALAMLGAAFYAFAPRPLPPFPPTEVAANRLLVLGLATAGNRAVGVGERGNVLFSDDEGRSWRVARSPTSATLTDVRFVDAKNGIAVGHDAVILRSEDGGETWTQVHAAPDEQRPLLAIAYVDAKHAIAAGAYSAWYESRDGGRTWAAGKPFDGDQHLNALAAVPDGSVVVAGEAGFLARSTDGGRTFAPLASPYKGSFFGVLATPDGGLLVYGLRGNAFRSADAGATWTSVAPEGAKATLLAGTLLPDGGVVLAGREGTILESRDQGRTFAVRKSPDGRAVAAVRALPGGARILAGEGGVAAAPR